MKSLTSLVLISILAASAKAQSLKSSFLLSSNFSYDKEVLETVYSYTFEKTIKKVYHLQPKVGYFILNRLCVGVSMPYVIEVNKSESSVLTDEIIGVGPFVKYYQPIATNFYGMPAKILP